MKISKFFSSAGVEVLTSEVIWMWLPVLVLYAGVSLYRKKVQRMQNN